MLLIYLEKFWFGANGPFWGQFGWKSALEIILKFRTITGVNKILQEVHGVHIGFSKNNSGFGLTGHYGPNLALNMTDAYNSGSVPKMFFFFLIMLIKRGPRENVQKIFLMLFAKKVFRRQIPLQANDKISPVIFKIRDA